MQILYPHLWCLTKLKLDSYMKCFHFMLLGTWKHYIKLACCRCLMILWMLAKMRSSWCIFGTPLSESNGSYCFPLKAFNFIFFGSPQFHIFFVCFLQFFYVKMFRKLMYRRWTILCIFHAKKKGKKKYLRRVYPTVTGSWLMVMFLGHVKHFPNFMDGSLSSLQLYFGVGGCSW